MTLHFFISGLIFTHIILFGDKGPKVLVIKRPPFTKILNDAYQNNRLCCYLCLAWNCCISEAIIHEKTH